MNGTRSSTSYGKAHPEVKEYVLWTAKTFGPSGMWLNEDACAGLSGSGFQAGQAGLGDMVGVPRKQAYRR